MKQSTTHINAIFIISIFYFILGLYILLIRNTNFKKMISIVVGCIIMISGVLTYTIFESFWNSVEISNYFSISLDQ